MYAGLPMLCIISRKGPQQTSKPSRLFLLEKTAAGVENAAAESEKAKQVKSNTQEGKLIVKEDTT